MHVRFLCIPYCAYCSTFTVCKALSNNHFFFLLSSAEMNLWIPTGSKGGGRGDLRTPWSTYTEINNSVKIFPLLRIRFTILSLVFLLMETKQGLKPGPAVILRTTN